MTSLPVERAIRKGLGAFYSPTSLVEPMVGWAVTVPTSSVLDPSCGDGAFLESAARRLLALGATPAKAADNLIGVDLNPEAIAVAAATLRSILGRRGGHLFGMNFFQLDPEWIKFRARDGVHAVIGNPPYIRYQDFAGAVRSQALDRASRAGVDLPQLTSSWAPFVAHATSFLKRGGRLALILPIELVHTSYAGPLREHLRNRFASVNVISFRQPVFPGVQEKVVLLLAEGYGHSSEGLLRLAEAGSPADLQSMDRLLSRAEVFKSDPAPAKWLPGYATGPGVRSLEHLERKGSFVPLGRVAKASIGFVSGANDFFVLTPEEAAGRRLPQGSLRPCVVRARQVTGAFLTRRVFSALKAANEQCLLWLPEAPLGPSEVAYVRHGERIGLQRRFKCRVRSPWYVVPGVISPDAFLTYMSDSLPRLCLNEAGVAASNNLLTIRMHSIPAALRRAFVVAFYNSGTLLSVERTGRNYGGGVLKLEPREADRVLVPGVQLVAKHREKLRALEVELHEQLCAGERSLIRDVLSAIDQVLFSGAFGREVDGVQGLAQGHRQLAGRRLLTARP